MGARWTCPAGPFTSPTSLTAPTRVAGVPPSDSFNNSGKSFGNIEGAVWVNDALYVSEIGPGPGTPLSRILRIDAAGTVTVAITDSGSNGMAVDAMGRLVTANHKYGAITAYTLPAGTPTQLVQTYDGKPFNSPNDVAIRSDGTIYFSDPDYQAKTDGGLNQTKTRLYKVAPGASVATVIDENRMEPNGVTLSLDETTLFVSAGDGIYKYPIDASGNVGAGVRFATFISSGDGMGMDCAGNLYVAANANKTLIVVSPAGTMIASVAVLGITNLAFGGSDHRTLYVTAMTDSRIMAGASTSPEGLFKLAMPLPGMPY
jgi:gluconolactonase